MDSINNNNRWKIRAGVVSIFLLGFIAGAFAMVAYHRHFSSSAPRQGYAEMLDQLQLTADQKAQVEKIFGDTREQLTALRKESDPKVDEIRRQADARLQQVLTPEQWTKFQKMRDDMRERRKQRHGKGAMNSNEF